MVEISASAQLKTRSDESVHDSGIKVAKGQVTTLATGSGDGWVENEPQPTRGFRTELWTGSTLFLRFDYAREAAWARGGSSGNEGAAIKLVYLPAAFLIAPNAAKLEELRRGSSYHNDMATLDDID